VFELELSIDSKYFILKKLVLLAILLQTITPTYSNAQPQNHYLNRFTSFAVEKDLMKINNGAPSSIKPFIQGFHYDADTIALAESVDYKYKIRKNVWARKLKQESLLRVDSPNFKINLNPLFYFEYGKDRKFPSNSYTINTRGVRIDGSIGSQFYFETSFLENQATMVDYIDTYVKEWEVVPGQGRVKSFKTNGFDYANASGHIAYSPAKWIVLQAGSGKHFIGNGYRSLLLSDNAFNYPFFKIQIQHKKFSYAATWASLQVVKNGKYTFNPLSEPIFKKKSYTFQYLTYKPINRLEIALFQGVVWETQQPGFTKFNYNILNPIIGTHAIQYKLDGVNNVVMGLNLNFKITSTIGFYAQLMADDIKQKKTGYQAGFKLFDVFKITNLNLQLEYNKIGSFAYANNNSYQSYSHYNQPLAHPAGANLQEIVGLANYRWHDFFITAKVNLLQYTEDSITHLGSKVIVDYTATDQQNTNNNLKTTVRYIDLKLGYVINRVTNLNMAVGAILRNSSNALSSLQTNYVYISIGTALTNNYFDF
jgi:hypothetical protein